MNDDQFNEILSYLKIIAQNTTAIVWQGNAQRPLTGAEFGQCAESVQRTVGLLRAGLDVSVLPPDVLS